MRRSLPLLGVALFAACAATPADDVVVGPWLRLERGNAAEVSELLAIELGHRAAVERDEPRTSPRPEVDAFRNAVRWCGNAAEVDGAAGVVRRLDVAREPDPRGELRQVSTWFVWPAATQARLVECIGGTFHLIACGKDGCHVVPVFRCTPDPASDVLHVRGSAWSTPILCEWLKDAR